MSFTGKVVSETVSEFKLSYSESIAEYKSTIDSLDNELEYFANLILGLKEYMYPNDLVIDLVKCKDERIILTRKTYIKFKDLVSTPNNLNPLINNGEYKEILNVYIKAFMKAYRLRHEANRSLKRLVKFNSIKDFTLQFIIKRYFLQAQKALLGGSNFELIKAKALISIYGKSRKKKKYGYAILRKTEDWGESLKFLISQSEKLNNDAYVKYTSKLITKREFFGLMKPYLYSSTNPKGLKWIIYSDKDLDHWVILKDVSMPNVSPPRQYGFVANYNITPTNFVQNEGRSQIKFTNECKGLFDIIETEELGLRDKIRALERYDFNYCLKTFKNDIQNNK